MPASMLYPRLGEPLPVELVNTVFAERGRIVDGLATPGQLAAWLAANGLPGPQGLLPATALLDDFRTLRSGLRALFEAAIGMTPPPAAAVRLVNRFAALAPSFPRLDWPAGGAPTIGAGNAARDAGALALATVAAAGIRLLGGPGRERLRSCHAPGCVLFFVKGHPRREWCSASCGNRTRVARHYRRHHAGAKPG